MYIYICIYVYIYIYSLCRYHFVHVMLWNMVHCTCLHILTHQHLYTYFFICIYNMYICRCGSPWSARRAGGFFWHAASLRLDSFLLSFLVPVCCSVLMHCIVLQCVIVCCSALHGVAVRVRCSVLRQVCAWTVSCFLPGTCVLPCVAVCCSALQRVAASSCLDSFLLSCLYLCVAVRCSALQYVALRCSALRCVAEPCSVLRQVAPGELLAFFLGMGWLRLVGSLKLRVSFAEYRLCYRALLQKTRIILRSLRIVATPYLCGAVPL